MKGADGWGYEPEGYQAERSATSEEYTVAVELAAARAAATLKKEADVKQAYFDAWAAALDARLGPGTTAELEAARKVLASADDTLKRTNEALAEQRAELARLEAAVAEPLTTATLDQLVRTVKKNTAATHELDAQRSLVAELERRQRTAVEAHREAERVVGVLATAQLRAHADALVAEIILLWSPIWEAFGELQRTEQLITVRGGGRWGVRLDARNFVKINDQLAKAQEG